MTPQDKSQGNKYPDVPLLPSSDLLLMFAIGQHQLEAREPIDSFQKSQSPRAQSWGKNGGEWS